MFIERSARRGWSHQTEPCIFIACESLETSTEDCSVSTCDHSVEDPSNIGTEWNTETLQDVTKECVKPSNPLVTHVRESEVNDTDNCFGNGGTGGSSDCQLVRGERLIDRVQFSDLDESGLENEKIEAPGKAGNGDTENLNLNEAADEASVSVVSCCKGVVTCSGNTGSSRKRPMFSKGPGGHGKGSFIPVPKQLRPGVVAVTPAPAKRGKSRLKKLNSDDCRKDGLHNSDTGSQSSKVQKFENVERCSSNKAEHNLGNILDQTEKCRGHVDTNREENKHKTKSKKIAEVCSVSENHRKSGEVLSKEIYLSSSEKEIPGLVDKQDKSCTESGRSLRDFEDSEPESAQHEPPKIVKNCWEEECLKLSSSQQDLVKRSTRNMQEIHGHSCNDFFKVGNGFEHCESKQLIVNNKKNVGVIKLVKSISPVSRVPVYQYKKQILDRDSKTSESSKDLAVSPQISNASCKSGLKNNQTACTGRNVKVFTSRKVSQEKFDSKLTSSNSFSSGHIVRNTFPYYSKGECSEDEISRNSAEVEKGISVHSDGSETQKRLHQFRSAVVKNKLEQLNCNTSNRTGSDHSVVHGTRTTRLRQQKYVYTTDMTQRKNQTKNTRDKEKDGEKTSSYAVPATESGPASLNERTQLRRNLPRAPAQVRTIKYGERVLTKEAATVLETEDFHKGGFIERCLVCAMNAVVLDILFIIILPVLPSEQNRKNKMSKKYLQS